MKSHENQSNSPPLWRNHNYLLLQSGQIVSFIGNQQQFLALPLLVLALTGSAAQAGLAIGLNAVATIVISPIAGVLVDRWNRKTTMLLCDAGRMFVTLTIPLAFWSRVLTMSQIYVAVVIASILGAIFSVANAAALPNVVTPAQLPTALSQSQAAYTSVRLVGSLIGGTLYSIGKVIPFLMCLVAAAEEFIDPIYTISLDTYRLMATPDSMRGRMSSTVQLVMQGAQSLGAIVGGILIQEVGAKWSALILGAWLLILAVATTLNRRVRRASLPTPESAL